MRRIEPIITQRIHFIAGSGQYRVQPQSLMIIEVFVAQRQSINALRHHLSNRMIHEHLFPKVVETSGQTLGQPETGVHLPQQQHPGIA